MQGAQWSRKNKKIEETNTRLQEFDKLPVIWLKPKLKEKIKLKYWDYEFKCPVYKTTVRKISHAFTISIPSDQNEAHWITRGFINYFIKLNF